MENGQRAKYIQNKTMKEILLLTKNAKLVHFSRGKSPIIFYESHR